MPLAFNRTSPLILGIFAVLLVITFALGLIVARTSYFTSIGILVGIIVFILCFVSTEIAIYLLIFATLLSPEFGSRETHGGGVTLRAEDFLLVLIGFSQLARSAPLQRRRAVPFHALELSDYMLPPCHHILHRPRDHVRPGKGLVRRIFRS